MYETKRMVCMVWLLTLGMMNSATSAPGSFTSAPNDGSNIDINVPAINCSLIQCTSENQQMIEGNRMFDETNFFPIVDAFGRTRKFWVHIPRQYDDKGLDAYRTPTIFAFHGAGQMSQDMLAGRWEEYFDRGIAFVIPQGEPNPCAQRMVNGKRPTSWMVPYYVPSTSPILMDCEPEVSHLEWVVNGETNSLPVHFWDTSMPRTFSDVEFVESLLNLITDRFPKLNGGKKYATGFSNGGALTYTLLCYRSSLFDGYSVTGWSLLGHIQRGDLTFDFDGSEVHPNSLAATCGRTVYEGGHATGITNPELWGYGLNLFDSGFFSALRYERVAKPVIQFAGEDDIFTFLDDVDESSSEIRTRNNLDGFHSFISPYQNTEPSDGAITERREYTMSADVSQPHAAYRELRVMRHGLVAVSVSTPGMEPDPAGHAIADAGVCDRVGTCDYSYTTETLKFFRSHADLHVDPFTIPPKSAPLPLK